VSSKKPRREARPFRPRDAERTIEALDRRTHAYAPADRAGKHAALTRLSTLPIRRAGPLLRYHEALCFLRAYPDDASILRLVEDALAGFGGRVGRLARARGSGLHPLDETGVAGSRVYCAVSYEAARWLARRFPDAVEIDWDESPSPDLGPLLSLLSGPVEEEALVDVGVPYRAWVAAAHRRRPRSDLAWLVEGLARHPAPARALYDAQEIRTRWALGEGRASRTRAWLAVPAVFFHRAGLVRGRGALRRAAARARAVVRAAAPDEARAALDAARAAVLVRYREVHAFNFADPGAVLVADVGRGVRIVWIGVLPAHRLPLRAHYGYLLVKNGVPVGYGDVSGLFEWADLAFNVFETFRQGESAFMLGRLVAFLAQRLGTRALHLSRFQIGHENEEALASGAFWFYYKLGFRPTRRDLAALAASERRLIARDRRHRSSRETLERLAGAGMFLGLGGAADPAVRAFQPRRVGLAAARAAAGRDDRRLASSILRRLGAAGARAWSPPERRALARLAPFVAAIPDLDAWPVRDRRALVEVIRAKGGATEEAYLRRLRAHRRLRRSILALGGPG
jgi:hypothetical protein